MNWLKYARSCGFEILEECKECFEKGEPNEECPHVSAKDGRGWTSCPLIGVKELYEDIKRYNEWAQEHLEKAREYRKKLAELRKAKKKGKGE